ncbi:MAG TPA: ATP-binding cassette domain-containing protein, partial [Tepidisphaeraceae bacterium]|nr:ATP-binding cassette domain-containing protein [Tepidisphaeraceae bacterium]
MNLLEIHNLGFAFRDKVVLENVDLSVQVGAILGIIGPNGAGKTTLVKLILGLLEPTSGTIQLNGVDVRLARSRGEIIGYLPQTLSIDRNLPIDVRTLILTGLAGRTGLFRSVS